MQHVQARPYMAGRHGEYCLVTAALCPNRSIPSTTSPPLAKGIVIVPNVHTSRQLCVCVCCLCRVPDCQQALMPDDVVLCIILNMPCMQCCNLNNAMHLITLKCMHVIRTGCTSCRSPITRAGLRAAPAGQHHTRTAQQMAC